MPDKKAPLIPAPQAGSEIPAPADPDQRREPLPSQTLKSTEDDPDALQRVASIIASPTYRQADADLSFLNEPESRGVRLQIDYLKPELLLEKSGVKHTIVVFGSTRIPEPAAARRRVEVLAAEVAASPGEASLLRRLAVAKRIEARSYYYEAARELGRLIGAKRQSERDCRVTVMTGGGPGIMEAANRGAFEAGAQSIGLNIVLPREQFPNPYVTPELAFSFHYFAMRKLHFIQRASALVVFPGGYGTLDELFETLALIQTRKMKPVPVVLVGEAYWRKVFDADYLVDEGMIEPEDRELFWFAETAEEIWQGILQWHRLNGTPLYETC